MRKKGPCGNLKKTDEQKSMMIGFFNTSYVVNRCQKIKCVKTAILESTQSYQNLVLQRVSLTTRHQNIKYGINKATDKGSNLNPKSMKHQKD